MGVGRKAKHQFKVGNNPRHGLECSLETGPVLVNDKFLKLASLTE